MTKDFLPVSLLSVVSKFFRKLIDDRLAHHLQKYGLFSDFQYGFKSFRSTKDLTVVCGRIGKTFDRPETSRAVTLDTSRFFDKL